MTVLNAGPIIEIGGMFKLYFRCPEKMSRIKNMCENTSYGDMTLTILSGNVPNQTMEHKITFGEGWMGKDAGIVCVTDYYDNLNILVKFPYNIRINNCRLESPEDEIQLGENTDAINNWFPRSVTVSEFQEWQEQAKAAWESYTEEEKEIRKAREDHNSAYAEFPPSENTPVRAGMEGVLFGKTD